MSKFIKMQKNNDHYNNDAEINDRNCDNTEVKGSNTDRNDIIDRNDNTDLSVEVTEDDIKQHNAPSGAPSWLFGSTIETLIGCKSKAKKKIKKIDNNRDYTKPITICITGERYTNYFTDKITEVLKKYITQVETDYLLNYKVKHDKVLDDDASTNYEVANKDIDNSSDYKLMEDDKKTNNNIPVIKCIFGDCSGVDTSAAEVCGKLGIQYEIHKADWSKYGLSAGPKRNKQMINLLNKKTDIVLAFHRNISESKGTINTINLAKKKGVEVKLYNR
jgi:hypothetical protein